MAYLIYFHLFYTTTFWGLKILHSKVRKFATKIASRQNSVNLRQKLPCNKNCVNHHHTAEIDTMCVKLHTVWKITHCVYNYTLSVKLHAECKITQSVKLHRVQNYMLSVKLHTKCKITHCVENYKLSVKLRTVRKIYTVCIIIHCVKFCVNCQKIPLTWIFTLPPVVAVVTIMRYANY